MGIKKLKTRGIVTTAVTAAVATGLCGLIALLPHSATTAQAGPAPGAGQPNVGLGGPGGQSTSPSATASPTPSLPPVLIIPMGGQGLGADGQLESGVALPPAPNSFGPGSVAPYPTGPDGGASCPSRIAPDAPVADVAAALAGAGGSAREFSYRDSASATATVTVSVPLILMDAIAWQESGWQSEILSCDGGLGTMQIMSGTATWMNENFGTDFSDQTLVGNTSIGAEYLEWLIAYYGETYYGGDFSLANQSMLNDVIAAYNTGPGNVNPTAAGGGIPNPQYVSSVEALERLQPWSN
jgi:hypothetical protein